jgi:hypothetical protein
MLLPFIGSANIEYAERLVKYGNKPMLQTKWTPQLAATVFGLRQRETAGVE